MKEGFLIGGGLIIVGLMLQWIVGSVVWDAFRWPVNGIAMAVLLVVIGMMFMLRRRVRVFGFMSTYDAAIPALVYTVVLTIVMGLTGWKGMMSFWPFVLTYVYLSVILGLTVLRQLFTIDHFPFSIDHFPFSILSHLGLFIALTAATLGYADMQRLKMIAVKGQPEWRALTPQKQVVEMPIAIELKEFIMEVYDDGKPKRFASDIQILTKKGQNMRATVDVNKPVKVNGWKIYQYGYDTEMGPQSQISILEFVRDPWLPAVYTGIYLLLAGAVLMMLRSIPWRSGVRKARQHPKVALLLAAVIAACFFCVHHFMPILHSDTLVPALQSPWFRPHIIVYMLAYTLMAAAAIIALYCLIRGMSLETRGEIRWKMENGKWSMVNGLLLVVFAGLSLITIGMLFGALWAKEAWGHYWSWDPKETWAAITWFAYLVYVHYKQIPTHKPKLALWMVLISFALLQMCWWGIKYLPSAQATSVHVYGM